FQKLRTSFDGQGNPYAFVDKTLLIRDFIDEDATVVLFTRPRRFGKTLTFSMLNYFFSCTEKDTRALFDDLKIASEPEAYWQHHASYPVISFSFKDIKAGKFENAYGSISEL